MHALSLMCQTRSIHSQTALKTFIICSLKETAKRNTHATLTTSCFPPVDAADCGPLDDSWSPSRPYSMEESSCSIGTCSKNSFPHCPDARELWRVGSSMAGRAKHSILFQPSAAVGSPVYPLLCFKKKKKKKKTADRSSNDQVQSLQYWCVEYIQL